MGGIFVGAVSAEILRKKSPKLLGKAQTRTRKITSGIKEAFKKGYENAMSTKQAVGSDV